MINNFDFGILDFIQEFFRCGFLDKILAFITHLGDAGLIWIAVGIVMLFFKKYRKCGITVLLSLALCATLTSGVIKPLVGRLRPFQIRNVVPYIAPPGGFSFPSGHTSSSFAAATAVFLCNKNEGVAAYFLAVLIAFSRLYFYVHFPTDVLAGAALGILCAFAVNKITVKYLKKL